MTGNPACLISLSTFCASRLTGGMIVLGAKEPTSSDDSEPLPKTPRGEGFDSSPEEDQPMNTATCIPVDIAYPTDTRLLNGAREALGEIINVLYRTRQTRQAHRQGF